MTDSSEEDNHIGIQDQGPVQPRQEAGAKFNMLKFLQEYAPQFDCKNVPSELDVLSEINSFKEKVKQLNFNYQFDRESYNYYSRLQSVVRLELTEFRGQLAQEMKARRKMFRCPGYYYELTECMQQPNQFEGGYDRRDYRDRRDDFGRRDDGGRRDGPGWNRRD